MLTREQVSAFKKHLLGSDDRLPLIFNALSDPGRYRIFKLLMEGRDVCVTDVAHIFEISVPAASQQLRILEFSGLVKRVRMGQMICYEVKKDHPTVRAIMKLVR